MFCLRRILAQFWCRWTHTKSWRFTPNSRWSVTEGSASMRSRPTCESHYGVWACFLLSVKLISHDQTDAQKSIVEEQSASSASECSENHTQPLHSWNISSYIFRFYAKLWCHLIPQLHLKLQCRYFSWKEDQTAQTDPPAVLRGHFSCECAAPSPATLCLTTPTGPCGLRGRTSVSSYQERAAQGKLKPPRRSCSTTRSPAPPTIGWLPWESACSSLTPFWRCCVGWFFHEHWNTFK